MKYPSKEKIEMLRKRYPPAGTKIVLEAMDDVQAPPVGTIGEVLMVDGVVERSRAAVPSAEVYTVRVAFSPSCAM